MTAKASLVPSYIPNGTANAAYSHGIQRIKTSFQQSSTIIGYHLKKTKKDTLDFCNKTKPQGGAAL